MRPSLRRPAASRLARLARLLGRAKRQAIRFTEHLTGDGPTVFDHVCRMGWRAAPRRAGLHAVNHINRTPKVGPEFFQWCRKGFDDSARQGYREKTRHPLFLDGRGKSARIEIEAARARMQESD